jgi:hypothetical protein
VVLPARLRLTSGGGQRADGQERRSSRADITATTEGATW